MTSSHLVELEKSELEVVLMDSCIRLNSNSIPYPFTNQCKKNISKIPNKISNEFLNKILLKNKTKKDKNINEIEAFKLNKKYAEEIEDLIERYIHEKQDFFLYLKTSIKNMLETLIKFHNLEIENHNENLRFESANKWIMDKKSLIIAFELIKKVIVSKNDIDE